MHHDAERWSRTTIQTCPKACTMERSFPLLPRDTVRDWPSPNRSARSLGVHGTCLPTKKLIHCSQNTRSLLASWDQPNSSHRHRNVLSQGSRTHTSTMSNPFPPSSLSCQRHHMVTFSHAAASSASSSSCSSPLNISKSMKPQHVRFMLYLRVLLKYLQRKDEQETYETLKLALHDCASKSRRHAPGYESLTAVMQRLIPTLVSAQDLDQARQYMNLFVQRQRQMHRRRSCGRQQVQAFQSLDPNSNH